MNWVQMENSLYSSKLGNSQQNMWWFSNFMDFGGRLSNIIQLDNVWSLVSGVGCSFVTCFLLEQFWNLNFIILEFHLGQFEFHAWNFNIIFVIISSLLLSSTFFFPLKMIKKHIKSQCPPFYLDVLLHYQHYNFIG